MASLWNWIRDIILIGSWPQRAAHSALPRLTLDEKAGLSASTPKAFDFRASSVASSGSPRTQKKRERRSSSIQSPSMYALPIVSKYRRRWKIFSLYEFSWLPLAWRRFLTDLLRFTWIFPVPCSQAPYCLAISELQRALADTRSPLVVDLCSGGGGPVSECQVALESADLKVDFVLTDLYPNVPAFSYIADRNPRVDYVAEPVDALNCDYEGFRTLFAAFHNFAPADARLLIQDAVNKNQGIAIFEHSRNSLPTVLITAFWALCYVFIATPFLPASRSWTRLFWTYCIPVIPILFLIESVCANLRTYSVAEMLSLAAEADPGKRFVWRAREKSLSRCFPLYVQFLVGTPKGTTVQYGKRCRRMSSDSEDESFASFSPALGPAAWRKTAGRSLSQSGMYASLYSHSESE